MSNGVTKNVDSIVNKERLVELLERVQREVQTRDQLRNELNQYISKIKDNRAVTLNDFNKLRTKNDELSASYSEIDAICSQISGFVSCYKLTKPVVQEVEELAQLIDHQEEQLKKLSTMIFDDQAIEKSEDLTVVEAEEQTDQQAK
ncbi:hypothetical protein [Candidatus Enterococcus ferrettii]|uniref:Uncharacterized protein n=1 Tax=Candidatus Enterococcus ferrettii TaxID=2815324 RepID=A0ABV0ET43_9ENTE|nr:hypothetical protein [Enterococcus sp. 665A]MBO1342789.1 hypothetical protein [Enterococcus sp. 665A]